MYLRKRKVALNYRHFYTKFSKNLKTKNPQRMLKVFRGVERIRTAVNGVADHCLATRPRHRKFLNFVGTSLGLNESANIEIISFLY